MKHQKRIPVHPKWLQELIKVANKANSEYLKRRPIEDKKEFDAIIGLIAYAQSAEYLLRDKMKSKYD